MARAREILALLILVVLGLFMAAAAAEVGVRLLHLEPDHFWVVDPLLGMRHIKGMSGWWTQEDHEFTVPVHISAQGWRDVPHSVSKPPGVFRILVLGDSFSEALQVPLEKSFPRLLEAELNRRQGRRVEVINTGVSGYGTAGELLLLRRDGEKYQPDLTLLAFYPGNDIMNNSPQLETTLVPVYGPDGAILRVKGGGRYEHPHGWRRLLARSKLYHYMRRILFNGHPKLARALTRWGLLKKGAIPTHPEKDGIPTAYYVYAPPDAVWNAAWAHTDHLLAQMKTECARVGAPLVVAIVSTREEVYPEWWKEVLHEYPKMLDRKWDLAAPRKRLIAFLRAQAIPYIDLTPAMLAARADGRPLHFHYDGHWTAAGHQVAAHAIANYLIAHGLIRPQTEEQHALH